MQLTTFATAAAALAGLASAGPVVRPRQSYSTNTGDGFPTPNDAQLRQIEEIADGTLADSGAPIINSSSVPVFQIIRFNENFEVAFFSSLISNITNNVKGFEVDSSQKEEILDILTTVLKVRYICLDSMCSDVQGSVLTPSNSKRSSTPSRQTRS